MNRVARQPRPRTTMPGTGELSQALEDVRDRETLHRFCRANVCTPADISDDGKRVNLPRVFDLMRARGYDVSEPRKPQHQPKKGFTAWTVHIRKARVEFDIAFFTANSAS